MKVGIYCPYSLGEPGGVKEHVLGLYHELKRRRIKVKVLAPNTKKKLKGRDFIYLGASLKLPTFTGSWGRAGASFGDRKKELFKVLEKERFSILHLHSPIPPLLSWQLISAFEGPTVVTFHSVYERSSKAGKVYLEFSELFRIFFDKKLKGVMAVSRAPKEVWREFFTKKRKTAIIPNGIDLKRFIKKVERKDKETRILFVGRIEKRKGLIYLLRAFNHLSKDFPNLRLWVVGSGPQSLRAKFFVEEKGLGKKVRFLGKVSDSRLPRIYSQVDIFCSPAYKNEAFGIVLLEAMATGLPIVAFANEGYKEVMEDYPWKKALVKPKRVEGLVISLRELIKDGRLRRELGEWGLEEVKQYDWQVVGGKVLGFYKKILSRRGGN